jgi:hypothetical protein
MTADISGSSCPNLFSMFTAERERLFRTRREAFVFSVAGQSAIVGLLVYVTCCVVQDPPRVVALSKMKEFPLIFSGDKGGGGGNFDPLPASHGNPPRASVEDQLTSPTVIVPREMPILPVPETVMVAPDIKFPQGQIGDPMSQFSRVL